MSDSVRNLAPVLVPSGADWDPLPPEPEPEPEQEVETEETAEPAPVPEAEDLLNSEDVLLLAMTWMIEVTERLAVAVEKLEGPLIKLAAK